MPRFNKTLKTRRGEMSFRVNYDNNYLTIVIDKAEFIDVGYTDEETTAEDQMMITPIFEGKISLKTEIDESGEITLPDWIRVYSGRVESEYHGIGKDRQDI